MTRDDDRCAYDVSGNIEKKTERMIGNDNKANASQVPR